MISDAYLRKLEQLSLVADRVRVGVMKGDRRSRKRGSSIEFADFRNYVRGDDLRRLDWNVYARLERPFIKLLEEEEDLAVHLLVDGSESMDWPDGGEAAETHKLTYARQLAGALGHVALAAGDRVTVTVLRGRSAAARWGPFRGKQHTLRLLAFLEESAAGGQTDLDGALREYALRGGRPGLLFLISDLFSPNGFRDGLNTLLSRGYEVGILHVLSPDELEPPAAGDLKLVDAETGEEAEITLDSATLDAYRERLAAWQGEIAADCARRGIHYVPVATDTPWDRLVLQTLRRRGVVR